MELKGTAMFGNEPASVSLVSATEMTMTIHDDSVSLNISSLNRIFLFHCACPVASAQAPETRPSKHVHQLAVKEKNAMWHLCCKEFALPRPSKTIM